MTIQILMEDKLIRLEDLPQESLPRFLQMTYRATPSADFAEYINRITINYNRTQVDPKCIIPMCIFDARGSEFDECSHIYLNFKIRCIKEIGLALRDFFDLSEIRDYEIYDINISRSEDSNVYIKYPELYEEYSVAIFFRFTGGES